MAMSLQNYMPGGTFFLTLVTHRRRRILTAPLARRLLGESVRAVRASRPFEVVATVLCPDHLHVVWALPEGDSDFSRRVQRVKEVFTKSYIAAGGRAGYSRATRRQRDIWQPRSWEHTCTSQEDLKRCVDYVHWNPVKHGLVARAIDYPWSTFHRYLEPGEYPQDWGGVNPCPGFDGGE